MPKVGGEDGQKFATASGRVQYSTYAQLDRSVLLAAQRLRAWPQIPLPINRACISAKVAMSFGYRI